MRFFYLLQLVIPVDGHYLMRHGQSTWNNEHRWTGHADPPLTELGRLQAKKACPNLEKMGFISVTSSGLRRARETASIVANNLSIELAPSVAELNERHSGDICGLTSCEIDIKFPGLLEKWRAGEVIEIPGGEPWPQFVSRILQGLFIVSSLADPLLVVIHEGVMRAIEYYLGEGQKRHENLEGRWVRACNNRFNQTARSSGVLIEAPRRGWLT